MDSLLKNTEEPKYHRLSFFNFAEKEMVDALLKYVVDVAQLPVFIKEPMGREKSFVLNSPELPKFCQCMEKSETHKAQCRKFLTENVHKSATYGRPYVGACPYGLSFAFGPMILKRGACTAALVTGYARSSDQAVSKEVFIELADSLHGESADDLEALYHEIPAMDSIKLHAIADFLCTVADFFMKFIPLSDGNYEDFLNTDMSVARNLIHDFYQVKGDVNELTPPIKFDNNEEAALIQAVSLGQRNVAEVRLRDILDKLLVVYTDETMALKGHIMELAVLISRAPLFQVSYSEGEAFSLNHLPAVNPPKTTNYLILKHWVLTVLHQSLDIIERKQNYDVKAKVIREVISYINSNLHKSLRVDDIAIAVSFSAQHLSRIFREEMGMTISEYITQARIEEAKLMLRTTSFNISQIAERLNYYDSTYFSKVFRKHTGLSPLAYKSEFVKIENK